MKTLTQYMNERSEDKVFAVYDRDDIFVNFFYSKHDADDAVSAMNNDTPSMKYHVKELERSEIENK